MPEVKIRVNGEEIVLSEAVTTFGRTSDNTVPFSGDSNVSRYHAEIEKRGDDLWLIDLGSSNGTTCNGVKVEGEVLIADGDKIVFGGGTSEIEIEFEKDGSEGDEAPAAAPSIATGTPQPSFQAAQQANIAADAAAVSQPNTILIIAGVICALAVICVIGAVLFYYMSGSSCEAKAVITKPEPGDTIIGPVEIEVDSEDTECVERAVFTIDGNEFKSTTAEPYTATLDPNDFPDLSDGFDHSLGIILIDEDGEPVGQPSMVALAFETREVTKPSPSPEIAQGNTQQVPGGQKGKEVSLIDIADMSKRFVKQFSGKFEYNVSNKQFLQEVQKKTAEYAEEGYFERASAYRDAINVAYVREQNLDAALGFVLAMSRSRFKPDKQGSNEGLWRMTSEFVTSNAYNGLCGSESLSDPSQNCAAKASALYMKAIVFGVFDGDPIYSSAVFGKSPQDAGAWKASLPANRADIWNVIKTAPEREQIVRFFAAGIVAENPQKFGLKKDQPLSQLFIR